jgi:hypothetical protein
VLQGKDGYAKGQKKKKKCYTVLRRLRRNERLANERVQQGRTRAKKKKKKKSGQRRRSVTPCSGDYVATNGWLTKGCSREEQGAVVQPHFKRLERDERAEDNKWPPKQRCVRPRTAPNSSKVHRQAGSTIADRAFLKKKGVTRVAHAATLQLNPAMEGYSQYEKGNHQDKPHP